MRRSAEVDKGMGKGRRSEEVEVEERMGLGGGVRREDDSPSSCLLITSLMIEANQWQHQDPTHCHHCTHTHTPYSTLAA